MRRLLPILLVAASLASAQTLYEEAEGIVIMEAESTVSPLGLWQKQSSHPDFTGTGYLRFDGNEYTHGPAVSPLEYTFRINQAGLYYLQLRVAEENQTINGEHRDDVSNDCYVRVDGNYEASPEAGNNHRDDATLAVLQSNTKFYGGKNDGTFVWAGGYQNDGQGNLDPGGHSNKRVAIYNFKAGETYTLVIHGRSKAFKIDRIAFSLASLPDSAPRSTSLAETTSLPAGTRYTYDARTDFPSLDSGDVPYYKDNNNGALAIDATIVENRNRFARASRTFDGVSGIYDATITTLTEEDGEGTYRLLVNGVIVGTYLNTHIGAGSELDMQPETHTWYGLTFNQGDTIAVESITHTNGEIPEGDGTAWARGRWSQLSLTKDGFLTKERYAFSKQKDLLLAQFDSKPDADDIHAQAALGSMLAHRDLIGTNVLAVSGAIGTQDGAFIDSSTLFNLAFGPEGTGWIDARQDWDGTVSTIKDKAKAILENGGKVWVQEAGQSDITKDWVEALLADGINEEVVKNSVIVVQHSQWNEDKTTPSDLAYVQDKTNYVAIDDGNADAGDYSTRAARGDETPNYVSSSPLWLPLATSNDNKNIVARALWKEADRIILDSGFDANYSEIPDGGVDFSDTVENAWIFEIATKADSVESFWKRYVYDAGDALLVPPAGRLAIVADGNSPDPDDIGATAVIFGILSKAGFNDRLVHLSHSCDLDPFKNGGNQTIDSDNELRRQNKLHALSDEGIALFGPFPNLVDHYNCRTEQTAAVNDLRDAINASSAADPLWIIEAGEPDIIGYALQAADVSKTQYVHVVSHHPANDDSGDFFTWQQILDFGVTEHQIGDQNVGLQTAISPWDWAENHSEPGIAWIWDNLKYAEQDGVVGFQTNKFDCSDAGMIYWWLTGANLGGNKTSTPTDIKDLLLYDESNQSQSGDPDDTVEPTAAPIAHWTFDEGFGANSVDASGNGHTATFHGDTAWGSDSTRSSFVSLDGSDDHISTPFTYALTASKDFTWSFWANFKGGSNGSVILGNRYPSPGPGGNTYEFLKITPRSTQFANTNTVGDIEGYNYPDLPENIWQHYAMVKSGTSYQWYVDGLPASDPVVLTYSQESPIRFFMGGDDTGSDGEDFFGSLDEVRLYEAALTPGNIKFLAGSSSSEITLKVLENDRPWTDAAAWSNNLPAFTGEDYFVPSGGQLRVPAGISLFPGNSLSIEAGGTLAASDQLDQDGRTFIGQLIVADAGDATIHLGAYHWTVDTLTIGTTQIEVGTYSAAQLSAISSAVFTGTGSLKVGTTTALQDWRLLHFSSLENIGTAALSSDANGDGENNLYEFATGQDPHADTSAFIAVTVKDSNLLFRYARNSAATSEGIHFSVEWSETLESDSWSTAGVTETIETNGTFIQIALATIPMSDSLEKFGRLAVSE